MKFLFKNLLLASFFAILVSGCGKYEDGPGISLRSKMSRMTGEWKLTEYTVGGKNGLSESYSEPMECNGTTKDVLIMSYNFSDWTCDIEKGGDFAFSVSGTFKYMMNYNYDYCLPEYVTMPFSQAVAGDWEFKNKKEQVEITMVTTDENFNRSTTIEVYDIIELRNKRMKWEGMVEDMEGGKVKAEMVFEKISN